MVLNSGGHWRGGDEALWAVLRNYLVNAGLEEADGKIFGSRDVFFEAQRRDVFVCILGIEQFG